MNNRDRINQAAPLLANLKTTLSLTQSAQQLGIQQSAVSHRLKSLEEALGYSLFHRTTRKLSPTVAGEILCQTAEENMKRWEESLKMIEHQKNEGAITLSVSSALAMKWLLPLLPEAKNAGLHLSLHISDHPEDLHKGHIDAALRFGPGPYPGLHAQHLKRASICPVASPRYRQNFTVADLHTLFQEADLIEDLSARHDQTGFTWEFYQSQCAEKFDLPAHRHGFERADLTLQAAIKGLGIALGRTFLCDQDLKDGFLEKIGPEVPLKSAYWLVTRPDFAQGKTYKKLLSWLKSYA